MSPHDPLCVDDPTTDEVRDAWVDHQVDRQLIMSWEKAEMVDEYRRRFDAWLAGVRADERGRIADLIQIKFGPISSRGHDSGCVCAVCVISSTLDGISDWLRGGDDD